MLKFITKSFCVKELIPRLQGNMSSDEYRLKNHNERDKEMNDWLSEKETVVEFSHCSGACITITKRVNEN